MKPNEKQVWLISWHLLETCQVIYLLPIPAVIDDDFMATMRLMHELVHSTLPPCASRTS